MKEFLWEMALKSYIFILLVILFFKIINKVMNKILPKDEDNGGDLWRLFGL